METLYIDIYFLINFTVDILALYFSCLLVKIKTTVKRLVFSGVIGAIFACICALLPMPPIAFAVFITTITLLISYITTGAVRYGRFIKFGVGFLLISTFLGGAVSFLFDLLDKALYPYLFEERFGAESRNALIMSMVVLLIIGIMKLLIAVFDGGLREMGAKIEFEFDGEKTQTDALLDSGNLLRDPFDMKPVIIVKAYAIRGEYKNAIKENINSLPHSLASHIRIIPSKSIGGDKILYGIKTDKVYITVEGERIETDAVIAIDYEKGDFGGYCAIVPASLII